MYSSLLSKIHSIKHTTSLHCTPTIPMINWSRGWLVSGNGFLIRMEAKSTSIESYFAQHYADSNHKDTVNDIISMLSFLTHNIFVRFGGQVIQPNNRHTNGHYLGVLRCLLTCCSYLYSLKQIIFTPCHYRQFSDKKLSIYHPEALKIPRSPC